MSTYQPCLLGLDEELLATRCLCHIMPMALSPCMPMRTLHRCSENGNQVCDICVSQWHLPLVNIGGVDIAEGHRGALLSLVWQVRVRHGRRVCVVSEPHAGQMEPLACLHNRQVDGAESQELGKWGTWRRTNTS